MLNVHESAVLTASAAEVWQAIGDFGNLAEWHPAAVTSTLETRGADTVRVINISGGGVLIEKQEAHDDAAMSDANRDGAVSIHDSSSLDGEHIELPPAHRRCHQRRPQYEYIGTPLLRKRSFLG